MSLLNDLEDIFENAVVDFHGQFHSTIGMWVITSLFGAVGFFVGYYRQSFSDTIKVILAGVGVGVLTCAIPWPIYSKNKIKWKKLPSDS